MISRLLPLLLAIVTFGVTLAILNWPTARTPVAASAAQHGVLRQSRAKSASLSPVSTFVGSPAAKPAGAPTPASRQKPPTAIENATESEEKPPDPAEERAPALIVVTPASTDSGQIATFQNLGPGRRTFTISALDASGAVHSSIEVTAPPHKREVLNEQGLVILPGDRILVQSPPYQEFSVSAD